MILEKYKFLLLYLILMNPPHVKQVSAVVTGKIQFFRNKYFDERSIHADIGRDMNVVCNHVKAFNAGKPNNNRDNNDIATFGNDNSHIAVKNDNIDTKYVADKTNQLLIDKGNQVNGVRENEDLIDVTSNHVNKLRSEILVHKDLSVPAINLKNKIQKREVAQMGMGGKTNMESDGNPGNMAHPNVHNMQSPPEQGKRLINCQNHYATPEELFRKKNAEIMKKEMTNLHNMRQENQFQNKFPVQDSNGIQQMVPLLNPENGQPECVPMQVSYQSAQGPNAAIGQEVRLNNENEMTVKEHPMMARLFEKQRQIENLKQLLMQVESKFQMEVNEVGRLQQSVAEAEKELDEAVRLMQDVKIKNIKGMQHIEAAQDAAGRNLESKALKAHAEESQLAMHDQVLFSERQRLNALRAQMIYLQTELASAQNSGILPFDDSAKNNFQPYAFRYKSPSLPESLKYFQSSPNKQTKNIAPYINTNEQNNNSNATLKMNPYFMFS
ncbi:hypothetical protein M8J75_012123 [Diaphorina citri]|nr:hypothetical protein M8J75_012123 [Diaphorina citri]